MLGSRLNILAFAFVVQSMYGTVGISCYPCEHFFHEATAHHVPGTHPSALRTSHLSRVLPVHLQPGLGSNSPVPLLPRQAFETSLARHLACLRLGQRQEKCWERRNPVVERAEFPSTFLSRFWEIPVCSH